jgi:hypothetical protein
MPCHSVSTPAAKVATKDASFRVACACQWSNHHPSSWSRWKGTQVGCRHPRPAGWYTVCNACTVRGNAEWAPGTLQHSSGLVDVDPQREAFTANSPAS